MAVEHLDVVIIGAGISGIGAAYHLQTLSPGKRYTILEGRDAIGGTWDLFRYPGIRSDSDMHTLGFSFRPWRGDKAIADGDSIRQYLCDTAAEFGIDQHIRFGQRVRRASFSTATGQWTVDAEVQGQKHRYTCNFLFLCCGYYRYEAGYLPEFPGASEFQGRLIHPQHWPQDLDYSGKRVVVIGSGATAITLVPAMTDKAAHVTMLQRSPSYVLSLPSRDVIANTLRDVLPARVAGAVSRWKSVGLSLAIYQLCRRAPQLARRLLRAQTVRNLGQDYPVDAHFNPRYNPWEQRLCMVPDADLFAALRAGRASIVTDQIDRFTPEGIRLKSGQTLQADVVVAATGLQMLAFGGIALEVDGQTVETPNTLTYKGVMVSGVPNMAFWLGYTNASWTLRADLTSAFACRILNHMDERGYQQCVPLNQDPEVQGAPLFDFSSGYVQRGIGAFPKQGNKGPWQVHQNYLLDMARLKYAPLADGCLQFSAPAAQKAVQSAA